MYPRRLYRNLTISYSFVVWTSFLAVLFPDITKVLAIMGGLCSVTICFVIPGKHSLHQKPVVLCYLRLNKLTWRSRWDITALCLFFGTLSVIGYASVVYTVNQIISSFL